MSVANGNTTVECECKRGKPALPSHSCPFKEEIGNDSETLCECCEKCMHDCCMDI